LASPPILSKGEDEHGSLTKRHWISNFKALAANFESEIKNLE
jgi:hypothetical protein